MGKKLDVIKVNSSTVSSFNLFTVDRGHSYNYSKEVKELYLTDKMLNDIIDKNLMVSFWFNGNRPILWFKNNNSSIDFGCDYYTKPENDIIYPLSVYWGDSEDYPLYTVVGYVIMKDVDSACTHQGGTFIENINIEYCRNIYNPNCDFYLGYKYSVTDEKIANRSIFLFNGVNDYPDYSNDISELYIVPNLSDATKVSIWAYGSKSVAFGFVYNGITILAGGIVVTTNNYVYTLKVYTQQYSSEDFPQGTLIGYVVFKDVTDFTSKTTGSVAPSSTINYSYAGNIKNSPLIAKSIGYYSSGSSSGEFIPNLRLPSKIYAVVGDTLQLYYRAILDTWTINNYKIKCVCSVGKAYPRYFEYVPTSDNIGTTTLSIYILNQVGVSIASGSTTIQTVSKGSSPQSTKKIFIFGDSLTSGGIWCDEMKRRLTGTGGTPSGDGKTNIEFCGSKVTGSGTRYFGVGGWSWTDYITAGRAGFRFYVNNVNFVEIGSVYKNNNYQYTVTEVNVTQGTGNIRCDAASYSYTPQASGTLTKVSGNGDSTITFTSREEDSQNPLWDDENDVFTFVPYVNQYGNGQIDVVYTLLSWNALPSGDVTQINEASFNTIKGYIKTFADKLHQEYPNAKLKLIGLQCPSLDGGYTSNYGCSSTLIDFIGLKHAFFCNKMLQTFCNDSNYSSFCEFVDAGFQFDDEYGEPYIMKAVNTRVPGITEKIGTNGVHPSTAGYYMFADAAYRNFVANFCQ